MAAEDRKVASMVKQPLDHLRSLKKPVTAVTWIAGDSELAAEVQQMEQDLQRKTKELDVRRSQGRPAEASIIREKEIALAELQEELEVKRTQLRENSIKFVFRSLGPTKYDKLLSEHPPTAKHIREAKESNVEIQFNPETFPKALIIASCVEPELDPEEFMDWLNEDNTWNNAEIQDLFATAIRANNSRRVVEMGKGS